MEKVISKMEWLRSIKRGETKTGRFESPKACHVLSTLIARYNVEEGRYRGVKITAVYDKPNCQVTITANKVDFYNSHN